MFDEILDSQFRTSSTEELEYKLEESFGNYRKNNSDPISEAVFRSNRFAEVDSLPFFSRAKVVGLSRDVTSNAFRCLKDFDFPAKLLVRGGSGNGNGGSLSDRCRKGIGLNMTDAVIAGATGTSDSGGL